MSGGYASSSVLLQKQAELKIAQAEYDRIIVLHQPQTATGTPGVGNAMSNNNGPPPGIAPGEDFGQYWKAIKDTTPIATKTADTCETAASYDSRLFRKIVYTGVGNLSSGWDKQCYGLIYNAPADTEYSNSNPSYYKTITPVGGYTKLGIDTPSGIAEAAKISDLEKKINGLVYDIVQLAPKATDSALSNLKNLATDISDIHVQIAKYMNDGAMDISNNKFKINQNQNRINVYDEINSQVELKVNKSKFAFYFFMSIILIILLLSYVSPLPLKEQIAILIEILSVKWWTGWGVITFVTILLIISSFGWDMRGNIAMVFRYITDSKFWSGELWWIGISLLVLIIVYLYTSFKQFFTAITPSSME
jgi:hypothetical protein